MNRKRLRVLLIGLAVLVLCGLGSVAVWVQRQLQPDEVQKRVAQLLRETFAPAGLDVTIGEARLKLGDGLRLSNLTITSEQGPVISVRKLWMGLQTGDLLAGDFVATEVTVEGFELTLRRAASEPWELQSILTALTKPSPGVPPVARLRPTDAPRLSIPQLTLREGTVRIHDESSGEPTSIVVGGLACEWIPLADDEGRAHFSLRGGSGPVRSLALSGTWNGPGERVRVSQFRTRLDLARRRDWSFPALDTVLDRYDAHGILELFGQFEVAHDGEPVDASIVASLSEGRARVGKEGFVLQSLSGTASLRGRIIVLERLHGTCVAGVFRVNGGAELSGDGLYAFDLESVRLRLDFPEVRLHEDLVATLPPELAIPLKRNAVRGLLGIKASLDSRSWPPAPSDWSVRITANGVSAVPELFALPVENLRGGIVYADGRLEIAPPLEGDVITGTVSIEGALTDPTLFEDAATRRPPRSGRLSISWQGLSCCRAVRNVLKADARAAWDNFSPVGKGDGETVLTWGDPGVTPRTPGSPTGLKVTVRPSDAGFQFRGFPLPVSELRGEILFDVIARTLTLRSLSGRYHDREIVGEGFVRFPEDGEKLVDLRIRAESAVINRALAECLPPRIAAAIKRYRVSGEAGVDVHLTSDARGDLQFAVELSLDEKAPLVVHPPELPTPLVLTSGVVSVREDSVRLESVGGRGTAEFKIDGEIAREGDITRARIRGHVRELELDARFETFLSEKNREAFKKLDLHGVHDFDFESEFVLAAPPLIPKDYHYRLTGLHTRGGGLGVAIQLADLEATGEIRGRGIAGETHTGEGELLVQSARFNRLHMENAKLFFVYGEDHPALAAGERGEALEGYDYVVTPDFRKRLKPGTLNNTLQILLGPAELYGGELAGFGYADLGELRDLRGHFVVNDMDISRAAKDVFGRNDLEASGTGSGQVRFSGLTNDSSSLQGRGSIEVSDGDIAQIPVISSILEKLSLGKAVSFDGMHAIFSILDEKFNVRTGDLVVTGAAMNVRGRGTMDFDGILDLTMTPEFISGQLPVFDQIKENLAHVRVRGGLSNPKAELVFARFLPLPLGDR